MTPEPEAREARATQCPRCGGWGWIIERLRFFNIEKRCPNCKGTRPVREGERASGKWCDTCQQVVIYCIHQG